jgi:hypothetical protein
MAITKGNAHFFLNVFFFTPSSAPKRGGLKKEKINFLFGQGLLAITERWLSHQRKNKTKNKVRNYETSSLDHHASRQQNSRGKLQSSHASPS